MAGSILASGAAAVPAAAAAPAAAPVAATATTPMQKSAGSLLFAGGFIGLAAFNLLAGHRWPVDRGWGDMFLADVLFFLAVLIGAGVGLKGRVLGVAIDKRNRISLARLQMVLWTSLILPATACVITFRLVNHLSMDAANVEIGGELLAAMGIAATSLVAAPTILSLKAPGTDAEVATNATAADAALIDIIRGDELGNEGAIDVSKLQQLAITLLLIGVYASVLYRTFAVTAALLGDPKKHFLWSMPALGTGFVALMAVSHAGYLAYKAAPKP